MNLFHPLAIIPLCSKPVVDQWLQLVLQLKMLTKDQSMLEVDPRARVRDICHRWKHLNLGLFLHKAQEVFAITSILVGKRQDLGCVEKTVFLSHENNLVVNLQLDVPCIKIRDLSKASVSILTHLQAYQEWCTFLLPSF